MKAFAVLALAALTSAHSQFEQFQVWQQQHGVVYSDEQTHAHRYSCFQKTLATIDQHNAKDTARHGLNKFSDLCKEEFAKLYLSPIVPDNSALPKAPPLSKAEILKFGNASSYDWRQHGAVVGVKDQGQCGSCWTFSAIASMEGAWFLSGNALTSLSEEQLVQCATSAGSGCQGGSMGPAIQYVIDNGGVNSESRYPYTSGNGVTGRCDNTKAHQVVAKMTKVVSVPTDESQMATYLMKYGPIAIAVDAMDGWQTYQGGVKTQCSGNQLDHGVSLVGFGVTGGQEFWIVKNSWAASWGEQGYIRLARGVNCDGMCNMASAAVA